MSLKTEDRANQILHVLLRHGRASIDDLIRELDTSAPNIRRDLARLEQCLQRFPAAQAWLDGHPRATQASQ